MEPISFKYHPVNEEGHETGFFASSGVLSDDALVLEDTVLPVPSIFQVINRYNRLTIVYATNTGQAVYTIAPKGGLDRKLKETLDRLCSYRWAEERHRMLEAQGNGAAFRTMKCPACTAVVDLTGFADSPQFYCIYCEGIMPVDDKIEPRAAHYRLCDRCRFYSSPIRYTATYLILNVMSWREHYSCHVCMRRECWKMLAFNLLPPFIGEFVAIYHTVRAYGAGMMDSYLPELVGANAYGTKGRIAEARALYETMLERVPVQAGLRYNLALAYSKANEWEDCLDSAHAALRDCSNYTPAAALVNQALTTLGRTDEAEHFLKTWGVPAPANPTQAPADAEAFQRRTTGGTEQGIRDVGGDNG